MLKGLRRKLIGEKFFGKVIRRELLLGETLAYRIREADGDSCEVYGKVIGEIKEFCETKDIVTGEIFRRNLVHPISREDGKEIKPGEYVEVEFPGWFREPRVNLIPAYAILRPWVRMGEALVENPFSEIVPVEFYVEPS